MHLIGKFVSHLLYCVALMKTQETNHKIFFVMSSRTTIYDIAKRLNITAATVSRALNDNPKISKKTRTLVIATAKEMNYKQNKLAVALKSGKSNNVGVVVPRVNRIFFSSVIRGIEERLYDEGYHVIICQTYGNEKKEEATIETLLNAQVDGIFMSLTNKAQSFKRILDKKVPLIFFDRKKDIKSVSSVTINDFEGAYKATQHLIDQGCKRIAHLGGDCALEIYEERRKGYIAALEKNNIPIRKEYFIEVDSKVEAGEKYMKQLLTLKDPPDAIFSSSDYVALGAIQELKRNGIKIPDDFCVVGFSNEPFTKFMELSISTVDQFPQEMGRLAANVFLDQVNSKGKIPEKKVVLTPELIIRKSSSRIKN